MNIYLRSSGQVYWNDTHQLNIYLYTRLAT
jgi:hypothetical protein